MIAVLLTADTNDLRNTVHSVGVVLKELSSSGRSEFDVRRLVHATMKRVLGGLIGCIRVGYTVAVLRGYTRNVTSVAYRAKMTHKVSLSATEICQ